jgi:hypothetical protein
MHLRNSTRYKISTRRFTVVSGHIRVKLKSQRKKILNPERKACHPTDERASLQSIADFSSETMKARRQWNTIRKMLKAIKKDL